MPLSRSRDYMSIGEVLEAVRREFPDVTISKIRFLESEGLISPERTRSGYRKFYDPDLARLRHILSLQRDHFLPLRVIKERLLGDGLDPADTLVVSSDASPQREAPMARQDLTDVVMSEIELGEAAGLSKEQLAELQEFGLVTRRSPEQAYDGNDLALATAASRLFSYGMEARHLRMFKQSVDREAALFEQILSPLTKRRGPESVDEASRAGRKLVDLSRQLREALLRARLRELL